MRETLLHADETGDVIDIGQLTEKGRSCAKTIHAGLSGAFQRWEMQVLATDMQFEKIEDACATLKHHLSPPASPSTSFPSEATAPLKEMHTDSFTTDEHRSFLSRVLGAERDDPQADS